MRGPGDRRVEELDNIDKLAEIFRIFRHLNHLCIEREMSKRGLSKLSNPKIMFTLKHRAQNSPVTQKQLAKWIGVAPPTVAVSIKRMEKAGLVRKQANQDDLRENFIALTEQGRNLTDESEKAVREVYENVFSGFQDSEMEELYGYIYRMITNMEGMVPRKPEDCPRNEEE
ncbi:MarR family winged helix-turn-helix transcriptional regulator [Ruminococcaceae bacterium OttesenSCG-928-L11]|nr:MarR family winged helix-turn-helix transcriptional regulator [Ruminococcaceae bacterium OttesenSCG-928-L11]